MDEFRLLLETLMTFGPPVHVFGGFAEDALLHGTSVRTHNDVDVLVGRDELEPQLRNAQIGFSSPEVRYAPIEGMPMVIGMTNGHLDLEISVYDRTLEGTIFFHVLDPNGRLVRIDLSNGVFDHPVSNLDGVAVRTVSPLALYQIRAGVAMSGGFGPLRPKDTISQEALRTRFFAGASLESLWGAKTRLAPDRRGSLVSRTQCCRWSTSLSFG